MIAFDNNVLKQVAAEIENLKFEFGGVLTDESIDQVARQSMERLANSRVPQFVPLFVGRFARERLQELSGHRPHARINLVSDSNRASSQEVVR